MSTQRSYAISGTPRGDAPRDTITGGYMVDASTALRNYTDIHFPGWKVVSCRYCKVQETKEHGLHTLWAAEIMNAEQTEGRQIWVREL